MKIACVGEAMIELSMGRGDSTAEVGFAGDTLNTAVYLQRALESAGEHANHSVFYVTALGTDNFSQQITTLVQTENIRTDLIQRCDDRVPGLYAINTDDNGERSFTYWRDQSAAKTLFSADTGPNFEQLADFDLIYYSAISLAILPDSVKHQWLGFLESYRKLPGKRVAFDSNYRPRLWDSVAHARQYTKAAFVRCDIAMPSVDDEMALFGDTSKIAVLERLASYGLSQGVLKCGVDGPVDLADVSTSHELPVATSVVDSTAAGDSFNGAYLAGTVLEKPSSQCIADGHHCAMRVIGFPGGIVDRSLWEEDYT